MIIFFTLNLKLLGQSDFSGFYASRPEKYDTIEGNINLVRIDTLIGTMVTFFDMRYFAAGADMDYLFIPVKLDSLIKYNLDSILKRYLHSNWDDDAYNVYEFSLRHLNDNAQYPHQVDSLFYRLNNYGGLPEQTYTNIVKEIYRISPNIYIQIAEIKFIGDVFVYSDDLIKAIYPKYEGKSKEVVAVFKVLTRQVYHQAIPKWKLKPIPKKIRISPIVMD